MSAFGNDPYSASNSMNNTSGSNLPAPGQPASQHSNFPGGEAPQGYQYPQGGYNAQPNFAAGVGPDGYPMGGAGYLGQPRSSGMVILLSIVTLGIYLLYWWFKSFEELKNFRGQGLGGLFGLLVGFFFSPVIYFVLPSEIAEARRASGLPETVTAVTGVWIFLPIAGPFIALYKYQEALNELWIHHGAAPAA